MSHHLNQTYNSAHPKSFNFTSCWSLIHSNSFWSSRKFLLKCEKKKKLQDKQAINLCSCLENVAWMKRKGQAVWVKLAPRSPAWQTSRHRVRRGVLRNEAQTVGKARPAGEGKKKGSDTFWVMQIYRAAWVELHEPTANRLHIKLHKSHMTWRVFSCSLCSTCHVLLSKGLSMQWQQSFYRDLFQGIG